MSPCRWTGKFTSDLLENISNKKGCTCEYSYNTKVPVIPRFLNNIRRGIEHYLENMLLIYDDKLEGQILAYDSNFEIIEKSGMIYYQDPRPHFNIKVNLILFRPVLGATLIGKIKMISKKHCSLVVYGCIPASVHFSGNDYSTDISVNNYIEMKITDIKHHNCTITLVGNLCSSAPENIESEEIAHPFDCSLTNRSISPTSKHLKRKASSFVHESKKVKIIT